MQRIGHQATVFEQARQVGGVWAYTDEVEDDPLGQRPTARVHSSLYASLRVNLPRDLMAFEGYTFDDAGGGRDRWPRYPGHARVLEYLRRFAADTGVDARIRFGHRVECVAPDGGWRVDGEPFDAVAVCNGHFSEPRVPALPGLDGFAGTVLHSHNYRQPDAFEGARVVVLGSSASGIDLTRELADVASEVFFAGHAFRGEPPAARQTGKVRRCGPVAGFAGADVVLASGERIPDVDAFVFCTGYWYRFPFLDSVVATVGDNHVRNLYRQLVPVERPSLAFIGLPFRVVPFMVCQRQARWFARLLRGDFALPDVAERHREYAADVAALRASGMAERHFHRLGDRQMAYMDRLAAQCGDAPVPAWFVALWREHSANAQRHPADYRDRPLTPRGPTRVEAVA